jgi:YcaO-like protein with predicted kinase domain
LLANSHIELIEEEAERVSSCFQKYLLQDVSIRREARASAPEVAYQVALKWSAFGGVVRLAECTGLDRLSIPNFYAVRPAAKHPSAIISSGKGLTRASAILSALFEAFERWAAEDLEGMAFFSNLCELSDAFPKMPVAAPPGLEPSTDCWWCVGYDLIRLMPCFVPVERVIFPAPIQSHEVAKKLTSDTNGLASGTNPLEAICSGILELIERDAIRRIDTHMLRRVAVASLPADVAELVTIFESHGVRIDLIACPSPTSVPVFYCLSKDLRFELSSFLCSGSGAHVDTAVALLRALTETSQSRVGFISALRDDVSASVARLSQVAFNERLQTLKPWFSTNVTVFDLENSPFQASTFGQLLKILENAISRSFSGTALSCVPLRSYEGLFAFRLYCPDMLGLTRP